VPAHYVGCRPTPNPSLSRRARSAAAPCRLLACDCSHELTSFHPTTATEAGAVHPSEQPLQRRGRRFFPARHRSSARPSPLLTADDVARRLGVSRDWVYAQSRIGRIPTVRLGRYRRYRRESIEDWLNEIERAR
jgi:excisionase family DNA binding protein